MDVVKPSWSSWSVLVYAGGFTVLGALGSWLQYLGSRSGGAGYAGWALLLFLLVAAAAVAFRRTGHRVTAGVFAFVAVIAYAAFLDALWRWFGWNASTSSLRGFHLARFLLELLWLASAIWALRTFRFPLIAAQVVLAGWLLVTDVISNGGDWSAIVTLLVGVGYLAAGTTVDGGPNRPYGFWFHLGAGMLIGGSVLFLWHGGNVEWTLVVIVSILYVFFADVIGRSSWAVLGAVGLLMASAHFALEWTHVQFLFFNGGSDSVRGWAAPLVFTCTGALLVALGLMVAARRPATPPTPA